MSCSTTRWPVPPRIAALFCATAAGNDTTLFEEVWALLEHHDAPHDVFEVDAAVAASEVIAAGASAGDPSGPERIGGYRILRLIDRGGMGVVYLAEQDEPRRQVALKVLQSGLVTARACPALRPGDSTAGPAATSRHRPGVRRGARTISATAPRPWFAMEFVDGLPITEFRRGPGDDD